MAIQELDGDVINVKYKVSLAIANYLPEDFDLNIVDIFISQDVKVKNEVETYLATMFSHTYDFGNGWNDPIVLEAVEYEQKDSGQVVKFSNGEQSIPITKGRTKYFQLIFSGISVSDLSYNDPYSNHYPKNSIFLHSRIEEILSRLFVVLDKPYLNIDQFELRKDTINVLIHHYKNRYTSLN